MAKWQRWERGVRRCCYKALSPPFRIRGFLGNCSRDLRFSGFSDAALWAVTWAFAQPQPIIADLSPQLVEVRPMLADISADRYGSSHCYCTTVTSVFSPQFYFLPVDCCF